MTRRLRVAWPDPAPFAGRGGTAIRILAISDEPDHAFDHLRNREAIGPVDVVIGCGDLAADYLGFVADAFGAPLVRVLGNHDRPAVDRAIGVAAPEPVHGRVVDAGPVPVLGLSWPGRPPLRDEGAAWRQAFGIACRETLRRRPLVVASHIPPRGAGDLATDHYHIGSPAYRWLLRHLRPPLWLHGHTPLAGAPGWRVSAGSTEIVNVTGSVLVELMPPDP